MNYYPHHIGDYLRDTSHLTPLEDGIYRRMLDITYASEKPLPLAIEGICRLVRARTRAEREAVDLVLEEFWHRAEDGWHNARADREIARAHEKSEKARQSAQASVQARAANRGDGNRRLRSERMAEARGKGTHTEAEWLALVAFCGGRCVKCSAVEPLEKDHITPVYLGGSDSIENLQPMCASCNSGKGPEATDYRPNGWQESVRSANAGANVKRTLNGRSATNNQEPEANPKSQEPEARTPDSPLRSESSAVSTISAASRRAAKVEGRTVEAWNAYSEAYKARYRVEPVRNRSVNGKLAQFVERIGAEEAPHVAAFYVAHGKGLYVSSRHCVDLLLRDAEGLRTEWATGRKVTETEARQADRTAAVGSQAERFLQEHGT